jgi:hypothetical protein
MTTPWPQTDAMIWLERNDPSRFQNLLQALAVFDLLSEKAYSEIKKYVRILLKKIFSTANKDDIQLFIIIINLILDGHESQIEM